ncbi:MAG: hypothetical protein WKF58_04000 [Ilumatobacteraceae bacterium]
MRTTRAWWPVAMASNPRSSARSARRANLIVRLHSMHGFGVVPRAWASTYGATTPASNSSEKLKTW